MSASVAGALTLPNMSVAVADRLSTAPSTASAGTGIWNVSCALFETGETCFAWLTLNAPCPRERDRRDAGLVIGLRDHAH